MRFYSNIVIFTCEGLVCEYVSCCFKQHCVWYEHEFVFFVCFFILKMTDLEREMEYKDIKLLDK